MKKSSADPGRYLDSSIRSLASFLLGEDHCFLCNTDSALETDLLAAILAALYLFFKRCT